MTKIRDEVARIREIAKSRGQTQIFADLDNLWITLDRLDLRFKIHQDPSVKAAAKAAGAGSK